MEKVLLGIIIIIVSSCNTTKNINNEQSSTIGNHDYLKGTSNGVLDSIQIIFFKENYNWKSEKNLIINFKESESDCKLAG